MAVGRRKIVRLKRCPYPTDDAAESDTAKRGRRPQRMDRRLERIARSPRTKDLSVDVDSREGTTVGQIPHRHLCVRYGLGL